METSIIARPPLCVRCKTAPRARGRFCVACLAQMKAQRLEVIKMLNAECPRPVPTATPEAEDRSEPPPAPPYCWRCGARTFVVGVEGWVCGACRTVAP